MDYQRKLSSLLVLLVCLNAVVSFAAAGVTSRYVRRLEATVDMPMYSDVFKVPEGYNAPQQVHITQGDLLGKAVIVSWVTSSEPGSSIVLYGTKENKYKNAANGIVTTYKYYNYTSGYIHHCTLKKLKFDTTYFYKIGEGNTTREFSFSTPPRPGPDASYTFGVIGDLGQSFDSNKTLQHYLNSKGQAVLFVGDLSYADNYEFHDNRRWDSWGRFVEKSTAYQPWIWTAGNHELDFEPDIVAETRFVSHTIVLRRPVRVKEALCQMVISNKWGGWKQVDTEKAKIVKDLIFSDDFWNRVEYALELTEPLMSMLRYADTDEPCLGNIYDAMDSMLERMKSGETQPFKPYKHRYHVPYRASNSTAPFWYSIKRASAYVIVLSSYSAYGKYTPQYKWLEKEFTKVDRKETPWLIVLMHTPWYNSNNYHFMEGESMRVQYESWFIKYKVDIVFAGHVHAYERSKRISNVAYNVVNGKCTPVVDPSSPVYITIGDGGNLEGLAANFTEPQPLYSEFREASFGHAVLEIKNKTHAYYNWHRNQDGEAVAADSQWLYNRYWYPQEEPTMET